MNRFFKISRLMFLGWIYPACFILSQHFSLAFAADNDREILNQLYQDIINSSRAAKFIKIDSMHSTDKTIPRERETPPANDHVSEQLKKEMDKIMKDAQLRHSDAVKFMQDAK